MNSFKKISKYLNKEAFDVIVDFINEDLKVVNITTSNSNDKI